MASTSGVRRNPASGALMVPASPRLPVRVSKGAHEVQFYESDEFLCERVAEFICAGLGAGDPVIVIATRLHREAVEELLVERCFDIKRAVRVGAIVFLDSEATLARFMQGEEPNWSLFKTHVGGMVRTLRASHGERPIRAYGEMVDVLWQRGNSRGAIRLEEMWNQLSESEDFSLLCGYALEGFRSHHEMAGLEQVCTAHSGVRPVEAFRALGDDGDPVHSAGLRQRALALEVEIRRREELEAELKHRTSELRRASQAELRRAETLAQEERHKLETIARELENASRMKDDFLSTVSHELRTPLNAMLGWVRMLRSGALTPEKRERALEVIERNANAQTQLIEDLLDVSRIISGKLSLDVGAAELAVVVEKAIEAVKPAAEAKGVIVRYVNEARVGPIQGDAQRLQQVVWNLLTNAVRFTPAGGTVTVAVRARKSIVEIAVADDGQGIAPDFLSSLFERFRQADATTTRKQGGLGLGLAIVRHIVEMHGGTVHAASAGEGLGATFRVRLPVMIVHPEVSETPRQHPRSERRVPLTDLGDLRGIRVLAVDDEQDALALLRVVLEAAGAEVFTVASGTNALSEIERTKPHVLVLDIGMPEMDGFELISRIRQSSDPAVRDVPAAALTAFARSEDRTRALRSGFEMHLAKPVDPGELVASVATLARRARSAT